MARFSSVTTNTRRHARRSSAPSPLSFLATTVFVTAAAAATADTFPYEPTTLLTLGDTVYAFQGSSFASYNVSTSDMVTTSPNWTSITDQLPFVGDAKTATYSATVANETLAVYAGDCKRGDGSIWVYDHPSRQWNRKPVVNGTDDAPFMLGGAVGFASTVDPDVEIEPSIYAFGGMCGTPSSSIWAWQSASDFTNHMIRLSADSTSATTNYNANVLTTQNTPIAAAGFTWTATTPAIASKAETVEQQVDHVMIGGHTAWAFVNMSSVALWQLPEEIWTFVPVANYGGISSRSGHTAVLSQDGSSLVLMGGWVGQVTNPASPQLIVLKMTDSDKNWKWEIPDNQPSGNGIFGHGATVLPGNVLMVYGGYDITSSGSAKRAISGSSMFYNMTSGEWASDYVNPEVPATESPTSSLSPSSTSATTEATSTASSSNSNKMRNIGLGLGLGLGVPALLLLILLCACLYRRHRSKKSRDDVIRALAQDESHFLHPAEGTMMERGGGTSWFSRSKDPWTSAPRDSAYESLRDNHNETAGSPIEGRASMQASRSGEPSSSRGAYAGPVPNEPIEPITENEEDDTVIIHRDFDVGHMADVHQPPPAEDRAPPSPPHDHPRHPINAPLRHTASSYDTQAPNWMRNADDLDDELLARMNHGKKGSAEIRNALAAVEGRPVSKASSNSNPSYSTAKSTFVALRNEGPRLLMGEDRPRTPPMATFTSRQTNYSEVPEDESQYYEDASGSPSKYRTRDSWLGSLRRVFSSKTDSSLSMSGQQSQSYASSPTRGDRTDGFMTGADYDSRILQGMADSTSEGGGTSALLRRKQGRQAWEDMPAHLRGSEDDWDVERAVEQRLVQVMFTVPQERSRVATAEYEREAHGIVVDPDESEDVSLVSNAGDISVRLDSSHVDNDDASDLGTSHNYRKSARRSASREDVKETVKMKAGLRGGASYPSLRAKRSLSPMEARGKSPYLDVSDVSSVRYSTELHIAEMIKLEKPKSRVREMVNSIESRHSRESSPAGP
ncbi:hypothetical protein HOO65_010929 [Ceratocystis lukuohia]|uniref:Galactose oxidase n=1 Tax=Ceratocystis lukuohia TaxID=2019550 RepID=A0ABR4MTG7_9PEZI